MCAEVLILRCVLKESMCTKLMSQSSLTMRKVPISCLFGRLKFTTSCMHKCYLFHDVTEGPLSEVFLVMHCIPSSNF